MRASYLALCAVLVLVIIFRLILYEKERSMRETKLERNYPHLVITMETIGKIGQKPQTPKSISTASGPIPHVVPLPCDALPDVYHNGEMPTLADLITQIYLFRIPHTRILNMNPLVRPGGRSSHYYSRKMANINERTNSIFFHPSITKLNKPVV